MMPHDQPDPDPRIGLPTRIEPGTVTLICGCMFSGKTTRMLRTIEAFAPFTARAFKHALDDRYGRDVIVTHGGQAMPAVAVRRAEEIAEHLVDGGGRADDRPGPRRFDARRDPETATHRFELIAVDEAHFFDPALPGVLRNLADGGRHVIVTSLDRDSWGEPLTLAERLREAADSTLVLHAVCARCGREADRTQRLTRIEPRGKPKGDCKSAAIEPRRDRLHFTSCSDVKGKGAAGYSHVIADADMIGGPEAYEPRCQQCWSPPA